MCCTLPLHVCTFIVPKTTHYSGVFFQVNVSHVLGVLTDCYVMWLWRFDMIFTAFDYDIDMVFTAFDDGVDRILWNLVIFTAFDYDVDRF